jgi:hypothetical protein
MEMRVDPPAVSWLIPGAASRSANPAIFIPRAESRWFGNDFSRAAPMPAISSSSLRISCDSASKFHPGAFRNIGKTPGEAAFRACPDAVGSDSSYV